MSVATLLENHRLLRSAYI